MHDARLAILVFANRAVRGNVYSVGVFFDLSTTFYELRWFSSTDWKIGYELERTWKVNSCVTCIPAFFCGS
jgi:hypothetical protein